MFIISIYTLIISVLRVSQSVENCYTKLFWFVHSNIHKENIMFSLRVNQ